MRQELYEAGTQLDGDSGPKNYLQPFPTRLRLKAVRHMPLMRHSPHQGPRRFARSGDG